MSSVEAEPQEYNLSDFDRRVRQAVANYLKTPSALPPEFLGYLGPYLETQNIQLPISSVVGNFLVANSADGLGGNVHGRTGMIRTGVTPFDYVQFVFDGETQKWASNPIFIGGADSGMSGGVRAGYAAFFGTTPTSYSSPARSDVDSAGDAQKIMYPVGGGFLHEQWVDAGFKAQVRLYVAASISADTMNTTLLQSDADIGGSLSAVVIPSWTVDFTTSTVTLKDSGWQDLSSSVTTTPKDVVFVQYAQKASTGTPTPIVQWVSIYLRYITP